MVNNYYKYRQSWRFSHAPHQETKLSKDEIRQYLKQGGIMLRNTYDYDCEMPTSFWYISKDQFGGMEELSSNVRKKVRRALKTIDFSIVDKDFIRQYGYPIYEEALKSYPIKDRTINENKFQLFFNSTTVECWIGKDKETQKVVCFAINYLWNDACEYEITGVVPEYRHNAPYTYYGLFYAMNEHYLGKKHFRYVTDGSRTITEHSGIQDYLIHNFNFRKAYCQLEVHYQWWMKIAVNVLYPFRRIITFPRIKAVLNMEAMQRGEK